MTTAVTRTVGRAPATNAFLMMCAAQMIALLGSQTTGLGFGIWFYERTGSVSINATLIAATMLPQVFAAPLVGIFVDRWERRTALLVGHAGAAVCALLLFVMVGPAWGASVVPIAGLLVAQSFMRAAEIAIVSSSTAALVPDKDRGRANGVVQLTVAVPQLAAPMIAAAILPWADLRGLLGFEIVSVALALALLVAFVRIPARSERADRESLTITVSQLLYGWRYVLEHRALLRLSILAALLNFVIGCVSVLLTPLILGITGQRELGVILSVCGVGMLSGAVAMAMWGGPRRRLDGIVGGAVVQAVALAIGAQSRLPWVVAGAGFVGFFVVPIMGGCNEAIWQRKVPAAVQGRVFSFRIFFNGVAFALAFVSAGPLVDLVIAPAMSPDRWLARVLGPLMGVGSTRGSAVAFLLVAALPLVTTIAGFASRRLRRIEDELPNCS